MTRTPRKARAKRAKRMTRRWPEIPLTDPMGTMVWYKFTYMIWLGFFNGKYMVNIYHTSTIHVLIIIISHKHPCVYTYMKTHKHQAFMLGTYTVRPMDRMGYKHLAVEINIAPENIFCKGPLKRNGLSSSPINFQWATCSQHWGVYHFTHDFCEFKQFGIFNSPAHQQNPHLKGVHS